MPFSVHANQSFLPDGLCDAPEPETPYPLWLTLAIFVGVFALLQWTWSEARDTWVERLVIHEATVKPAATLVQWITPDVKAQAVAASIKAPGDGLNILNGCEGTEVMFLLIATFAAVNLGWRQKLIGLGVGLVLTFALKPFDVNEILAVLRLRANSDFGTDTQAWVSWFLDSEGIATERERETFRLLKKSKDQNDRFISKFSKKSKGSHDNGSGSQ